MASKGRDDGFGGGARSGRHAAPIKGARGKRKTKRSGGRF